MSAENTQEFSTVPRINIRVESLSDLVFGLALSIGSLELLARTPQNPGALATSVGLFAFSFLIVIAIWLGYTRIMAVMPQNTGGTLSLNLLLLFCVVLEPYLFFVLQFIRRFFISRLGLLRIRSRRRSNVPDTSRTHQDHSQED